MLILALLVFGLVVGGLAQLIVGGKNMWSIDWGFALVAGVIGSFVGGLLISLLTGHGIEFHPSGIIGSLVGAILVTAGWIWFKGRAKTS